MIYSLNIFILILFYISFLVYIKIMIYFCTHNPN